MIYIVDYGAGNLLSVKRALFKLKFEYEVIHEFKKFDSKSILIIPGVGNFNAASENLNNRGFNQLQFLDPEQRPFVLGICLGMQMLFSTGNEGGHSKGLNLLEGNVDKIIKNKPGKLDLPTTLVGWEKYHLLDNYQINFPYLNNFEDTSFYHVHSYMCLPKSKEEIIATYPFDYSFIPNIVGSSNKRVLGFQFHPEKSSKKGLEFLKESLTNILR